jgi:hypothetical protein
LVKLLLDASTRRIWQIELSRRRAIREILGQLLPRSLGWKALLADARGSVDFSPTIPARL